MNQEEFDMMGRAVLNQCHDMYTQGIVDTILSFQHSLKSIEDICKDETSYKVIYAFVNSMIAEKIYGGRDISINPHDIARDSRYKLL